MRAGLSRIALNAMAARIALWTDVQDLILTYSGFAAARDCISSSPRSAPTPLVALPGMAAKAGVAAIDCKDEGGRFRLGPFKAPGGAYAVARLLQRPIGAALGALVPMADIVSRKHADLAAETTICCAADGNHGRSVAWGARTFGARCVISIHATVSAGRKTAIEAHGAELRRCDGNFDDSVPEAQETATREGGSWSLTPPCAAGWRSPGT